MPIQVSYPGVYVQEIPSQVHSVTAVTFSATAFVGFFSKGPMNKAVRINSLAELNRQYGGLDSRSEAGYGLLQFFNNGGQEAWVIRVAKGSGGEPDQPPTAISAQVAMPVLEPTAQDLAGQAQSFADDAKQLADSAWVQVYGTSGSPPASPPEDLAHSPPPTPLEASPPGGPQDILNAAGSASQAADLATQAAAKVKQAAQYAAATALKVSIDLDKASPALAEQTWLAAEQAAAAAWEAAMDAEQAAAQAVDLAASDPLASPPPSSPPDPQTEMQNVAVLQEAARTAMAAADTALRAAQAAQAAANEAEAVEAGPSLTIRAANEGVWGNCIRAFIEEVLDPSRGVRFNLYVDLIATVRGKTVTVSREVYRKLTLQPGDRQNAIQVVNEASELVQLSFPEKAWVPGAVPQQNIGLAADKNYAAWSALTGGADGSPPLAGDLAPISQQGGIYALDQIAPNVFNILCIPEAATLSPVEQSVVFTAALNYSNERHAFFIVDIPKSVDTTEKMKSWLEGGYSSEESFAAATYYPRLTVPDPLNGYRPRNVAASGTMAGVYARTDLNRGIWKAPAGIDAVLEGADVVTKVTDTDSGILNELGVNVLRSFPVYGNVSWGARTLAGADLLDSEWKYINVRRLVDFIEQSLVQSLKWVVFEPNDETTWGQVRLEVGSYLAGLFADGAFAGTTPDQAYLVRADATTTTPADIDRGILNILVGVAPVRPAEFVIIKIEQIAGQTGS